MAGHDVKTLFEMAEEPGLATGVVSTARITHATPAAIYAHTPMRDWESDKELGDAAAQGCKDIADQLVNWPAGDGFEVALGGGRAYFLPETLADPEDEGKTGRRTDGRDLTAEWTEKGNNHVFVFDKAGFDAIDVASGPKVLGLFEMSHMEYEADRAKDAAGEPSIAEMTAKAIDRLQQDDDGFVLMVEGGRIDHAHHAGNAYRALEDTIAFDAGDARGARDDQPRGHADRRHRRPQPLHDDQRLPGARQPDPRRSSTKSAASWRSAGDGKPYTTISYANGPGGVFPALAEGRPTRRAGRRASRPDRCRHDRARLPPAGAGADGLRDPHRRRRRDLRLGPAGAPADRDGRAEPDLSRARPRARHDAPAQN